MQWVRSGEDPFVHQPVDPHLPLPHRTVRGPGQDLIQLLEHKRHFIPLCLDPIDLKRVPQEADSCLRMSSTASPQSL